MTDQTLKLNINLNAYSAKLTSDLDAHLIALKTTLKSIRDGSYSTHQMTSCNITKMVISIPDPKTLEHKEINKCFKCIIGSLQDFMDKLIAIKKLSTEKVYTTKIINNEEELKQFILDTEKTFIQDVSKDKSLKAHKKLELLKPNDITLSEMISGYFTIRNSLEHHKEIADRDINLIYRSFILYVENKEIFTIPFKMNSEETLKIGSKDISRLITKNSIIKISEAEVEGVVLTIKFLISIALIKKLSNILNNTINQKV